jgi:hypothetical protein
MSLAGTRARVTVEPRRLWTLRASLGATCWVLYGVALVGVVATARDAIAPPRGRVVITAAPRRSDAGAAWFALSFARAYLTWSTDPSLQQSSLSPFVGAAGDPDAGMTPASGSAEAVRWLALAGERDGPDGERDYTVAAGTGDGAVRYLGVAVGSDTDGGAVLERYPSLVAGPKPIAAGALDGAGLPTVTNAAVVAVLERAMRNYIDASDENLAADLAAGAVVAPVAAGLSLRSVVRLAVEPSGAALATVVAADSSGDLFTLSYELTLRLFGGRWEITRIQS